MAKFAFLIVCTALLSDIAPRAAVTQTVNPNDVHQPKLSITKCCRGQYNILTDSCKDLEDDVHIGAWPPTVYSHRDNRTLVVDVEDVQLTYDLVQCPDKQVTKVITDFLFYDDGSLTSLALGSLSPGRFCLDQMKPGEDDDQLVARFCVVNPCNETNCIHKCCPHGMAVDDINKVCMLYPEEFSPVIRNENGSVVDGSDTVVLYGAGVPVCLNEMFSLRPALYPEDEFYILPSGELYVTSYTEDNRIHKNCIDTFIDGNISDVRALVCFQEVEAQNIALNIYPYLMFISAVFLIVTFIVYGSIAELRNLTGIIIMCYSITLAVMFISLGTIQLATTSISLQFCICLAVIAHFSFLSTFTWLNVMSIATWLDFRQKSSSSEGSVASSTKKWDYRHLAAVYALYAWGLPLCIVIVARVMDLLSIGIRPDFGVERCWFSDDISAATYLYAPVGVLILVNIVFFLMTIVKLHQANNPDQIVLNIPVKRRLRATFCLFILMGISWIMEVFSFAVGGLAYIWIPTDILNILTGIGMFTIFVCNRRVRTMIAKKLGCKSNTSSADCIDSVSEQSQTFMTIADHTLPSTYVSFSPKPEEFYYWKSENH